MTSMELSKRKPLPQTPNHRHTISGTPSSNGTTNLLPTVETSKQQNKSSLVNSPSPVFQQTVERSVRINTAPKADKGSDKRPNGLLSLIDMDEKETKLPKKRI